MNSWKRWEENKYIYILEGCESLEAEGGQTQGGTKDSHLLVLTSLYIFFP